jgi:UDP-GlcNAc:undecaprenyl-phosphate GlcNAc-1-phosphate transferase
MREYALVLLIAAAVTYLLTPLVRRVAMATHAMHEPRARDTHTEPTPLLGGLAMYGGLVAGLLVAGRLSFLQDPFQAAGSKTAAGLVLAGGFVVVVGFVDDRWGLSAISKLAAQVAAAGILVWSGQSLPWLPTPSGGVFSLEPDLSVTLTILLVVVTINAINFIDGLDGLAAGIVAVAALSFLAYSYALIRTINTTSQSLPAVASALLAGVCLGFLPHNFYPARIFMGDIGAMLLGLLLAYGPISSTDSLDPVLLTNYAHTPHTLDRFPTFLPLLVPAAIFIIPYADLMFAIIRRTRAGKPLMSADRQHLHHRLLNIGHSYRQSVLLMYLWAALFATAVVSLSLFHSPLVVFAAATLVALFLLLSATMPGLRPWRAYSRRKAASAPAPPPAAPRPRTPAVPAVPHAGAVPHPTGVPYPTTVPHVSGPRAAIPRDPFPPAAAPTPDTSRPPAAWPPAANQVPPAANGAASSGYDPFSGYSRNPDPFPPTRSFPGQPPFPGEAAFPGEAPFGRAVPLPAADGGAEDGPDPFSQAPHPDVRPRLGVSGRAGHTSPLPSLDVSGLRCRRRGTHPGSAVTLRELSDHEGVSAVPRADPETHWTSLRNRTASATGPAARRWS